MYTGIISEFDPQGCFGLIESDEGEILLFGRDSLRPNCSARALHVGQRVGFTIDEIDSLPRARAVTVQPS